MSYTVHIPVNMIMITNNTSAIGMAPSPMWQSKTKHYNFLQNIIKFVYETNNTFVTWNIHTHTEAWKLPCVITLIKAHPVKMTEALPRKKRIRAGHHSSATRILGQITTALEGTPPDQDRLALLKLTLNAKLETLNRLDSEIIELTAEADLDDEIQQSDDYKERIY